MENFKQMAEDCLAGKLSGTFVLRNGKVFHSQTHLSTTGLYALPYCIAGWYYSVVGNCYSSSVSVTDNDVIDFIPDNMQEQIKIDIPEGKVPVMEQTEKGVFITWKEKELTYTELSDKFKHNPEYIHSFSINSTSRGFFKKVEVLRKLTNIRNYFGKPKHFCDGVTIKCVNSYCGVETGQIYFDKPDLDSFHEVVFAKREHAEQAIKMLGDELKYLFEPW